MTNDGENRRSHERVAAAVKMIIKREDDDSHLITNETESLDISESGILLNSDVALPDGMPIRIELHLSESLRMNANWPTIEDSFSQDVIIPAKVVRSRGAEEIGYQVAISFNDDTDTEKLKLLSNFLDKVKSLD